MTLVLSVFPNFVVGGAQARFCTVANHFGHSLRHAILAIDGRTSCRERLDPGLCVSYPAMAAMPSNPLSKVRRLQGFLAELRPDVLLTHNWGSIDWALANLLPGGGAPVRHVHVEDGFGPEEQDRQLRRRVWARRLALRRATVVLPSRRLMRLAETVWRLDGRRLRYTPNGVDLSRFPAGPARSELQGELRGDGPVIGTVAVLRPEKNIARLLHAAAAVPAARLVVVGDGPERLALAALAGALGLDGRIAFTGHLADPVPAYRQMDVFALSSDTEQMPLSVLEAMAAGLPIAATDVGDVADMVAPENRPFVVPRKPADLAAALMQLVADAGLRRSLGAANRIKAVRDYDERQMLAGWGRLLGA